MADKLLDFILKNMRQIKDDMKTLNENRAEAEKFYRGDPEIVEIAEKRSKATTSDLFDVVEWAKPSLLEIFAGGDEVCSLSPASEEDVPKVEKQNLLVNMQMKVKNNWFMVLHDWLDDALKLKVGWIKYQWYREEKSFTKEYNGLTQAEYDAKIQEDNVQIVQQIDTVVSTESFDPLTGQIIPEVRTYDVVLRYTVEDEYPLIEAVPAEDFGFPIRCRHISDAEFCWHRTFLPKWKVIKKYGKAALNRIEKAKDTLEDRNNEVARERFADLGRAFFWKEETEEYIFYEVYYRDPDTGDPKIVDICFDELFDERDNKYLKPPFHGITPIKMAHRVAGFSFYDLIKEIQCIRTALLRQILDNVYFSNNRRYFGDTDRLNIDDYLNNNVPGALIRTYGDPNLVIKAEEKAPLPSEIFPFWELLNTEKDYHSGVPRSFQGVNPDVLNKTWRGQNQQVSQASQRIAMMARLIAEMAIRPLINDVVDLNIRFLKKKTAVRYLNDWVEIEPDNIVGKYDVIVNVGLGTGNKQEIIAFVQQLLGIYAQIMKAGVRVVTPTNVYNAMKELVKAMGFRNVGDFVTDPKFGDAVAALLQILMQRGILQGDPQIGQIAYDIALQLGLVQPPKPGQERAAEAGPEGTFPGQERPAIPVQPAQPMNPTLPMQGGYFG